MDISSITNMLPDMTAFTEWLGSDYTVSAWMILALGIYLLYQVFKWIFGRDHRSTSIAMTSENKILKNQLTKSEARENTMKTELKAVTTSLVEQARLTPTSSQK